MPATNASGALFPTISSTIFGASPPVRCGIYASALHWMTETPLQCAQRLQQQAATEGFDWEHPEPLWAKLSEEIAELRAAGTAAERQDELGDLLFMVVNIARHLQIDPEQALSAANAKFSRRYAQVIGSAVNLPALGDPQRLIEMERRWQVAKSKERKHEK